MTKYGVENMYGGLILHQIHCPEIAVLDDAATFSTFRNALEYVRLGRERWSRLSEQRGGLVCLNSAARFDKWNRAAVR